MGRKGRERQKQGREWKLGRGLCVIGFRSLYRDRRPMVGYTGVYNCMHRFFSSRAYVLNVERGEKNLCIDLR